jgi:hypothetical protein
MHKEWNHVAIIGPISVTLNRIYQINVEVALLGLQLVCASNKLSTYLHYFTE